MVNAFVSLKTAGDDDQFKNELQYIMNSKMKLPCSEFAAWLLHDACRMSFAIKGKSPRVPFYRFLHNTADKKKYEFSRQFCKAAEKT